MATEQQLQQRIRNAHTAAMNAVKANDQKAYAQAKAAYEAADKALRLLEAERNKMAIEQLEAKAAISLSDGLLWLSYDEIVQANVPTEILQGRGWTDGTEIAGMWKHPAPTADPAKPKLALVK